MLVAFSTTEPVDPREVGGKAASLIRLQQGGARVPNGFALTTEFFAPWMQDAERSHDWHEAVRIVEELGKRQPDLATRSRLAQACDRVKAVARQFALTAGQRSTLGAMEGLGAGPFAIRSSSPEEDLSGASFAGQYESVLGVASADVEEAIRTCFVSCLDSRVLLYKHEMKFTALTPAIAVVVQQMVASDTSGVAFSLNPLTNDYDEVLINAGWGLGEALVSGEITPDSAVVNKFSGEVIEHRAGDKGGDRSRQTCLNDAQLAELVSEVKRIEEQYQTPIDIEWAFANRELYILQARPITTYVPLPKSLLTQPGEQRHLYMDGNLTEGITMSGPVAPMSMDLLHYLFELIFEWAYVPAEKLNLTAYGFHVGSERMYIDISAWLHVMGNKKILEQAAQKDPTIAAILLSPELDRYRPKEIPWHRRRLALFPHVFPVLWRMRRAYTVVIGAMLKREQFKQKYRRVIDDNLTWVHTPIDFDRPVAEVYREDMMRIGTTVMDSSYPAFVQLMITMYRVHALIDENDAHQAALVDDLFGGYEDDMVVQMGHSIFDLSRQLPPEAFADLDALLAQIEARSLPAEFLETWDTFIDRFGHRAPLEMDLVNNRYADDPRMVLQQAATLARAGGDFNPHDMHAAKVKAREDAYEQLCQVLPPRKAKKLRRLYADCLDYNGAREYFKHHLVQVYSRTRKHVVLRAKRFVADGRLDRVNDVFQMRLVDVDRAHADPSLDLRALVEEKGALYRQQLVQVRHFPLAIDSRGRIMRGQFQRQDLPEGTLSGVAVSAGVATGPVKVLNDPFEKELQPGDVLVAVTTDPGWTPLFITAAAVILEIGGELQHGALVAREYGKPCVSGIGDVTRAFKDGQIVEVDGNTGLIRIVG